MRMHNFKWLIAAGLAVGALKAYHSQTDLDQWLRRHQFSVNGLDQALPTRVYFLETNRWLEFDIPKDVPMIRVISNGSVAGDQRSAPGTEWPYAIEYQLRDNQARTVDRGVYHFKGEQLVFLDKVSNDPVEVNSYLDRRFSALGGRRWILNLIDPARTNVHVLQLRLHSSHTDLLEVGVRVYFKRKLPERKLAYRWNRLSDDQKRDLARGNVYSIEGLNAREQHGLLRNYWAVAAPEGIPGRDFHRRILHIRDDSENLKISREWEPSGIALDARHSALLPITNGPGGCELETVDARAATPRQAISGTLLWQGNLEHRRRTNRLDWSKTNHTVFPAGQDGFLEASSSEPVYLRAFRSIGGERVEITPEPMNLAAFPVSPREPVAFAIEHVGTDLTLFRVDLRHCFETNAGLPPVRYELVTEDQVLFQAGEVRLTNTVSTYDWIVTSNGRASVSIPQSLCFLLPPAVRSLRIQIPHGAPVYNRLTPFELPPRYDLTPPAPSVPQLSPALSMSRMDAGSTKSERAGLNSQPPLETVFVTAYSRPLQLTKRVLVPEDYSPAKKFTPEQPSWFSVRPSDYLARRATGRISLIRVQGRLPDYEPLIEAGQYEWESFLPDPLPTGNMVLMPREGEEQFRTEGLSFAYSPVPLNAEQRVRFEVPSWEPQLAPTLMLVCTNGTPGAATVNLDGRLVLNQRMDAPVTALRLGNLEPGEHTLRVDGSESMQAFINYRNPGTDAYYLQRFCVLGFTNTLQFPYIKREPDAEVLVLRVFSPAPGDPQPFKVHVQLKPGVPRGIGPFPELTLLEREATVTPNPTSSTYVVAAAQAQLDDGQIVLFPVGPDIPPGPHNLEVTIESSAPRWLSLSRTTPGRIEKLEITSKRRVH